MPNLKCKICGTEFPPIRERHYISRDLTKTGLAAAFGSSDELAMFDSYDCPCCGSQVIAQPRKRQYDPKSEEATEEDLLADMSNETIAEYLGLNPAMIGHLRAAQSSGKGEDILKHLDAICDKFNSLGYPNIIFDKSLLGHREEYKPTVSYVDLTGKRKPSSLYFTDAYSARAALSNMQDVIEKNGFISIAEADKILGGEHSITSKWGWTDLSKAHIVKSENTSSCYISFPAICDRPEPKEACKKMYFDAEYQKGVIKELMAIRKNLEVMAKTAAIQEKAERVKLGLSPFSKEFPEARATKPDDIIAVDFDGTLVMNAWPEIGLPIMPVIEYVKRRQKNGARLILWTNRTGEPLEKALAWCAENDIVLSAVNENLPDIIEAFGGDTRKIFANEYLDDRAVLPDMVGREWPV